MEAVEDKLCLLEVPEMMCCVLLCMQEVFDALEVLDVSVMRCVLLCLPEVLGAGRAGGDVHIYSVGGGAGGNGVAGGDVLCARYVLCMLEVLRCRR